MRNAISTPSSNSASTRLHAEFVGSIRSVSEKDWRQLNDTRNPFLSYAFLAALEDHQCVGLDTAWRPDHLLLRDSQDQLIAAMPLYQKLDSWGEFVFDWAWADAYARAGLEYYPKLVAAIPFTPATGPRILIGSGIDPDEAIREASSALIRHAEDHNISSVHILFPVTKQHQQIAETEFMTRLGCQFHWYNHDYADFDDFLQSLTSKKRKQIKRERRIVRDQGITVRVLDGSEATNHQWETFYRYYCSTFFKRGHHPSMSLSFFIALAETLPKQTLLTLCSKDDKIVAAAFMMRDDENLYGRHWGCQHDYDCLHFDACYYTGIEYAITHGLKTFEPGAQGEHKIPRGFLPTPTWSSHWIAEPQFRTAIRRFLKEERAAMTDYIDELNLHSPYKQDPASCPNN
ncbi:MAG TPA: N-acetyltransferase [Chromatiaceae bacterium]|nr:N-acetyltransferase [Chromatiaceae bacterium]HIA08878.1 N-acetyltransferase [Chromatiaceae bacterium]